MRKYELFTLLGLLTVIAIPIILNVFIFNDESSPDSESPSEERNDSEDGDQNNDDTANIVWGVDSASYTDENLYQCVIDNFGDPEVWGRYLVDREGVSAGLDADEVEFLHDNDIQILVIYNHANDVTGYEHGQEHTEQAISFAEEIEVPEGVSLFLNVEPEYPIDSAFLEAWYETLDDSIYEPGVYGVYDEDSELLEAYQAMEEEMQENTIVWTAYPQEEITTEENAPEFNPQGPENAMLYGWQYAIEAEACNIDTNLFTEEILDFLW